MASPFLSSNIWAFLQNENDSQPAERKIHGQVVDEDGEPAALCKVVLFVYGQDELESATCNDQGKFSFSVDEDVPFAMARAMNLNETLQAMQHISLQGTGLEIVPLNLQLEPTISTKVTVRHEGEFVSGALVAGLASYGYPMIQGRTDIEGELILRTPVSFPLESIWVFDKTRGVAFWYPALAADTVETARKNQPAEVTLDLLRRRTCAVKVVDMDGNPVAGVEIFPYFRIEEDSNRKFFPPLPGVNSRTGKSGIAKFDWMPAEPVNWFIPSLVSTEYRKIHDDEFEEDIRGPRKTMKIGLLPKKYPVRGKLVGPGNANLAGIKIIGDGSTTDAMMFTAVSDENGVFQFEAIPDATYSLVAMHPDWASDTMTKILLDGDGKQLDEINVPIYPATKVTITVTRGQDPAPVARGDVMVERTVTVPSVDPLDDNRASNTLRDYILLNDQGQVAFGLGQGDWSLTARSGQWSEQRKIEITDSNGVDIQIHCDWMGENTIAGNLSLSENTGAPIALNDAMVTVVDYTYRSQEFATRPDAEGNWSVNADTRATFAVIAYSGDMQFGNLKIVNAPDDLPVNLQLTPTTSVAGTLVDHKGYPYANKEMVLVYEVDGQTEVRFGSTKTNDDGEFQFPGVITGLSLKVAVMRDTRNFTVVEEGTIYEPGEAVKGIRFTLEDE